MFLRIVIKTALNPHLLILTPWAVSISVTLIILSREVGHIFLFLQSIVIVDFVLTA